MGCFPWQERYSVGIGSIDRQHQKLVDPLDDLYQALNAGKGKDSLGRILRALPSRQGVQVTPVPGA